MMQQKDNAKCTLCPWMMLTGDFCTQTEDVNARVKELIDWIQIYEDAEEKVEKKFEPFTISIDVASAEEAVFLKTFFGHSNGYDLPNQTSDKIYNQLNEYSTVAKDYLSDMFGIEYCDSMIRRKSWTKFEEFRAKTKK